MHRWARCPGSVKLSEGLSSRPSEFAKEGTLAHEVAQIILTTNQTPKCSFEILEAVQVYIDTLKADTRQDHFFWVEHRFDLSDHIESGLFGTADYVSYNADKRLLRVYDYKHGAGIAVEVKGNLQLRYYALGCLLTTDLPVDNVEMVIVQPRCPHEDGPVRRERISVLELLIDFKDELVDAVNRTKEKNAPLKEGAHCRFCPAQPICPKLHEVATSSAALEFKKELSYDPVTLSKTLTLLPTIEAWTKAVREFAYQEALNHRPPPGFKLVHKRARRVWANEDEAKKELKTITDDVFEHRLKTPAQVEKIIKDKNLIKKFTTQVVNGTTLVPSSDKRKEVSAQTDFDPVGTKT